MTTLPLVWLVSVLTSISAYALALHTRTPVAARLFLCTFLLALAAIGLLLGVRLSFGVQWAARIQPLVAVMIAPSAFLGFRALTQDRATPIGTTLLRDGWPVLMVQLAILSPLPVSADIFVLAINCVYLFRISTLLRHASDDFTQVPPQSVRLVRFAIYATIVLIGMMVAADLLIVSAGAFAGDTAILPFLTGVSGVLTAFVFVVALVGAPMVLRGASSASGQPGKPTERDHQLAAALEALMADKKLYTDSNLTLSRVARRLSVPARDISAAINRVTGENFSRHINGFRIRYAQSALRDSDLPVTEIMFDAGFVSKSSFNTEFRRITGMSPSQFRAQGANA